MKNMRTNLKGKNEYQNKVIDYIEVNASDELVAKINNGKDSMEDCWSYITQQARKMAVNGCACVEDLMVYGWAMHFFEEGKDACSKEKGTVTIKAAPTKEVKEVPKKVEKKPKKVEETEVWDMFSMVGE